MRETRRFVEPARCRLDDNAFITEITILHDDKLANKTSIVAVKSHESRNEFPRLFVSPASD